MGYQERKGSGGWWNGWHSGYSWLVYFDLSLVTHEISLNTNVHLLLTCVQVHEIRVRILAIIWIKRCAAAGLWHQSPSVNYITTHFPVWWHRQRVFVHFFVLFSSDVLEEHHVKPWTITPSPSSLLPMFVLLICVCHIECVLYLLNHDTVQCFGEELGS